jgi:hypothetical protein
LAGRATARGPDGSPHLCPAALAGRVATAGAGWRGAARCERGARRGTAGVRVGVGRNPARDAGLDGARYGAGDAATSRREPTGHRGCARRRRVPGAGGARNRGTGRCGLADCRSRSRRCGTGQPGTGRHRPGHCFCRQRATDRPAPQGVAAATDVHGLPERRRERPGGRARLDRGRCRRIPLCHRRVWRPTNSRRGSRPEGVQPCTLDAPRSQNY